MANATYVCGVRQWQFLLDQVVVRASLASLLRLRQGHSYNNKKLMMVDLGQHHCSVKLGVVLVGSGAVAEVCGGGGMALSCLDPLRRCATLVFTNFWVVTFWVPIGHSNWVQGAKKSLLFINSFMCWVSSLGSW